MPRSGHIKVKVAVVIGYHKPKGWLVRSVVMRTIKHIPQRDTVRGGKEK